MLILTRLAGETVIIGNDIRIQVLSNKNGQVRIGIDAPRDIPVMREEIADKGKYGIPQAEAAAADSDGGNRQ